MRILPRHRVCSSAWLLKRFLHQQGMAQRRTASASEGVDRGARRRGTRPPQAGQVVPGSNGPDESTCAMQILRSIMGRKLGGFLLHSVRAMLSTLKCRAPHSLQCSLQGRAHAALVGVGQAGVRAGDRAEEQRAGRARARPAHRRLVRVQAQRQGPAPRAASAACRRQGLYFRTRVLRNAQGQLGQATTRGA